MKQLMYKKLKRPPRKLSHEEILKRKPTVSEVRRRPRSPIYFLLDNIRSLHNVGAIFRTADAVMAEKIFLCGMTGIPPRREIEKTALGATDTVPWEYHVNAVPMVTQLKKQGVQIVCLELTDSGVPYYQSVYNYPCCLVVGHEINGISDEIVQMSDLAIEIPMHGRANSLNVATALGIAAYDILMKLKTLSS